MVRCLWFFGSLFDDSSGSFHYCDHPYSGAVLPVQRSYINARERLRLRWTKKETSKQTNKKTHRTVQLKEKWDELLNLTKIMFKWEKQKILESKWKVNIQIEYQLKRYFANKRYFHTHPKHYAYLKLGATPDERLKRQKDYSTKVRP